MIGREAIDAAYSQREYMLAQQLPSLIREAWNNRRRDPIAEVSMSRDRRVTGWRARESVGAWSPATACMVLNSTCQLVAFGGEALASPQVLFSAETIEGFLNGPSQHLAQPTKILLCHNLYSMAERVLKLKTPWLITAANNLRQEHSPSYDLSGRFETEELREAARICAFPLPEGYSHDIHSALSHRDAALIAIAAELAPRLGELHNASSSDILTNTETDQVTFFIPESNRKAGGNISANFSQSMGDIVLNYINNARIVLLNGHKDFENLWISSLGRPIGYGGLGVALRKRLKIITGKPGSANLFRRALASRVDICEPHLPRLMGHSRSSGLAMNHYAYRDPREGHNLMKSIIDRQRK